MRCFKDYELDRVSSITERCNLFHGAPIHIGNPSDIGILNITKPDWGEPIVLDNDDIPVFWACGVTITNILQQNKLRSDTTTLHTRSEWVVSVENQLLQKN